MFGSLNVETINLHLDVDPTADKTYHLWRAPDVCTVKRLSAVTDKVQGAGTANALRLVNYGTAGATIKLTGGTVSATIGGTENPMTQNVPTTTTEMLNPYIDAGEWVMLVLDEQGSGWQAGEVLHVQMDVVYGQAARNA